jgi:DNA polymerase-3 subunit epsilon
MMEPRTLKAAYMFYCGQDLVDAHAAEADTFATYEVLKGQLSRYADDPRIENNVEKLAKFSTKQRTVDYAGRLILNDKDEPTISFGKHKGKTAREVYFSEPSYFAWIDNGDFTLDTKSQFAKLKAQYEEEKRAARPAAAPAQSAPAKTAFAPRTKGYTPFEGLGDLFSQQED